jgi:hypothetical protein
MSEMPPPDSGSRRAVRRLLTAIDRALAAAREVEMARAALDRAVVRQPELRVITGEREDRRETPPE